MPATQTVTKKRRTGLTPPELAQAAEFVSSLAEHEPNEETIAALREAEDLDSLTECADVWDMLAKCGLKR
jgi:hypothetical protein